MSEAAAPKISSEFVFVRRVFIVGAIAALALGVWLLSDVLLLLFGSVLFAMTLSALARPITWLSVGETASLIIAGLLVLAGGATAIAFFGTEVAQQFQGLYGRLAMVGRDVAQEFEVNSVGELLKQVNPSGLASLVPRFVSWGVSLGGALIGMALVIVGGLYLAANPRGYREGLVKLVPPAYHDNARATLKDVGEALNRWLGGQLISMVVVGVLTGLGLWLVGVQSALALGLLAGLLNFIPYLGSISAAIITLIIAGGQSWDAMLWAAAVMAAVQQVESNFLAPFVVGRVVSLQPAIGLYAIVAMGVLFGPLGLLFGFPLAIAADVSIRRLYIRDTLDEPVEILGKEAEKSAKVRVQPG